MHHTGRLPTPTPVVRPPVKHGRGLGIKLAIGALALGIIAAVGLFLMKRIEASRDSQRYSNLLLEAVKPETREIPMSGAEFTRVLTDRANADTDAKQRSTSLAIEKATPDDSSDLSVISADFITETVEILPEIREVMIREILTKRMAPQKVPDLMEFARSTKDVRSAIAIFEVIAPHAGDDQFEGFLSVSQYHPNADMRKAAEEGAIAVIKRSNSRSKLLGSVEKLLPDADARSKDILNRVKTAGS